MRMVRRVPKMGRCPGLEQRRIWGEGAGAENRDVSLERVRHEAADRHIVLALRGGWHGVALLWGMPSCCDGARCQSRGVWWRSQCWP
jgi:hypothetical protein